MIAIAPKALKLVRRPNAATGRTGLGSRPAPKPKRTAAAASQDSHTDAARSAERAATRERRAALAARRQSFFERPIEFIACREFRNRDAERLATVPPADAAVPLARRGHEPPAADGLTPYLASLYQTRLLTRDEEQFYFRRMNWLKFRAATARGRLPRNRATARQIDHIEGWLTEAETVKAILITSNLRLVVSIAKKFVDPSWSFEELVSEGNIALMRAVEKFNFALGNRFSTYATYAIQRHFYRLSHRGRQLRKRFVSDDEALKGRAAAEPTNDYCSAEQIDTLKQLFAGFLGDLEPRERQIVVARFGFDGKPPRTFRELGSHMGVCKERIRQIQSRAMDKIRDMAVAAKLEQTVGDWL
jgi:RNA polymerase primary sigma factor